MHKRQVLAGSLVSLLVAGCGGGDGSDRSQTASAGEAAIPALASRPPADGEIVVRGESSPRFHGPYTFDGRYVVRFEQYAPEDADLDFSVQTPFTAALQRREGDPTGGKELFVEAKRSGRRERTIRGRYFVEVSFGDFPYVIRVTPRR